MEPIIINREPNIKSGVCYRVGRSGYICDISKEIISKFIAIFSELKKEGNSISNIEDLSKASEVLRKRNFEKTRILKKDNNSGYIFVGGLTCIGILLMGMSIFMAIKFILVR